MNRYNFRANLDYQVTSSLKSFLNIGSYIEQVNMPAAWLYGGGDTNWMMRDLLYQAQTILPITPGPTTIDGFGVERSEEHTSELQSLMRISYAVFCLKKKKKLI